MLSNEKYMGDALLQKTYTVDFLTKKKVINRGIVPQYYIEDDHDAIIPKELFYRVQEEKARRASIYRPGSKKRADPIKGKYSSKFVLSDICICGRCGQPYRRQVWSKYGVKKPVWRCDSRLKYGTKKCSHSPTLAETTLHEAIMEAINSVVEDQGEFVEAFRENVIRIIGSYSADKEPTEYDGQIDSLQRQMMTLIEESAEMSAKDEKALKIANFVFLGIILFIAVSCIPQNSWLRNPETGSLIDGSLLLDAIVPLFTILFFVPGLVYGRISGKFKNSRDLFNGFSNSMRTLSGFICVAFAASQFINYFNYTNLGRILSINGANVLQELNIGPIPLMLVFILVSGFMNLFMTSASAKYAIFAPVFVPMFMTLGISPELTQVAYRIGDSCTNIIAPVLSSLPIILQAMKRYDKDSGFGTLVSCMLPYTVVFMVSWSVMLVIWMLLKLPLGPGAYIYM